jgi:PAS domain S-box-containing protein
MKRKGQLYPRPATGLATGYVVAVGGTAAAALLRWVLCNTVGEIPAFITFYPVVLVSAALGGRGPGLLATFLSALAAACFLIEPRGQLAIAHVADAVGLAIFIAINVAISLLSGRFRLARQATLSASAQLEAIIANMTDALVACDPQGNVLGFNPAALRLHGFSTEAQVPKALDEFHQLFEVTDLGGQPRPIETWPLSRAIRGEVFTDQEVRVRRRDTGQEFIGSFSGTVVPGQDRSTTLAIVTIRDITRHNRLEAALRASEVRYRRLFEAARDGVLLLDIHSQKITDANPFMFDLLGYTHEDLVGKELWEIGFLKDAETSHAAFDRLAREGRIRYEDLPLQTRTGEVREVEFVSNVYDEGGRSVIQCNIRDITRRKQTERQRAQAEEAVRAARTELARANAELEQNVRNRTARLQETIAELEHFSYTITHDMRAPLRAMRGLGGLLLEECSECLHPTRREYIRRIAEAADRMDRLITDALQYSGVVRQQFVLVPVDAGALLRGMLESYPELQPAHANIRIDTALPVVLGNQAGLTQCFSNLLGNAVKFVHPGQTPEVRVWAEAGTREPEPEGQGESDRQADTGDSPGPCPPTPDRLSPLAGRVRIWFEDKGIGIEKEYHDKIWEMFQQLNRSYEGTGIGLALVRKVVERMGGEVGVESEPGHGSRFWVELKRAEGQPGTNP